VEEAPGCRNKKLRPGDKGVQHRLENAGFDDALVIVGPVGQKAGLDQSARVIFAEGRRYG